MCSAQKRPVCIGCARKKAPPKRGRCAQGVRGKRAFRSTTIAIITGVPRAGRDDGYEVPSVDTSMAPGRRSSGAVAGRASGGETLSAPHLQQYEKQAGCGGQVAPDPFPVMAGPAARDLTILHPQRALRDRSDLHYAPDHAGR